MTRSANRVLLLVAASLAGLLATPVSGAPPAAKPGTVELATLVLALMPPADSRAPVGWQVGSDQPIRWKTPGPQPLPRSPVARPDTHQRYGTVMAVVDGQPTHWLYADRSGQGKKTAGGWVVRLAGTQAAPIEANLGMDATTDNQANPIGALERAGFKLKALCQPQGAGSAVTLYRMDAPGRHTVMLVHGYSSGSAGSSQDLTLIYTKEHARRQSCM
ncbi:hypothetical protein [uncultured Methylibium sp.]|uniref:hypothetical protein n=1 Tax=uncultured Methylibium sp. TaxID=381093 RepID=UPI0025FAD39D|nr:hypothetical protein [uncultured Methylibium sp.]